MNPFSLKKWYFDLVTPGGDALYVYFIVVRFGVFGRGLVSAHIRLRGGREFRATEYASPRVAVEAGILRLGHHLFSGNSAGVNLTLRFKDARLDLRCATLLGSWRPTRPGLLWQNRGRFLSWEVAQAATSVRGSAEWGPVKVPLSGQGYQDIVETTLPPWALPLSELIWGRAHCGDYVVIFNQARTREGGLSQSLLVRRIPPSSEKDDHFLRVQGLPGIRDDHKINDQGFSLVRDEADRETVLAQREFSLALNRQSILEDSPVVTPERFKSTLLRSILKRRCGDPHELKMISRAELEIAGKRFPGLALHERVTWNWGGKE